MNLSLVFLQLELTDYDTSLVLNRKGNPSMETVQVWSPYKELSENTLYFCPWGVRPEDLKLDQQSLADNIGLIWLDPDHVPKEIPALVFSLREADKEGWILFNAIIDTFNYYNNWAEQVHRKILHKCKISEIFRMLNLVTDNGWYMCDSSFRVHPMKMDPQLGEMSAYWKYQLENKYLPLETVIAMEETGELAYINSQKQAVIVDTRVFYNKYISKTLFSENGILGHFFITSGAHLVDEREREIADYFGNLINDLIVHDHSYLPTRGRYYDNFFIDLIESKAGNSANVISQVFYKLEWEEDDDFVVFVHKGMKKEAEDGAAVTLLKLQVLEKMFPCQTFQYKDSIVGVYNVSRKKLVPEESINQVIARDMEGIHSNIGGVIGVSDRFHASAGFINLSDYYNQAAASISIQDESEGRYVYYYKDQALTYLCNFLEQDNKKWMFYHPSIDILLQYDKNNGTELCYTLKLYLDNDQNAVRTAKSMYIHRNSLLYRLERIRLLTDLDLSDPNECLRLSLSLNYTKDLFQHIHNRDYNQ